MLVRATDRGGVTQHSSGSMGETLDLQMRALDA